MHPMTQLSISTLSLQKHSQFAKAYEKGIPKTKYWEYFYEDSMNLMSVLPKVAAMIYNNTYKKGAHKEAKEGSHMAEGFAQMLGFNNPDFINLLCHYLVLHSDHEGGN